MEWETTPLEDARRFKDNIFFILWIENGENQEKIATLANTHSVEGGC